MGSSEGLYTQCLYTTKIKTTNTPMLKIAKGTIQPTLTYDAFDNVLISGDDAVSTCKIGTKSGGWLMN